MQIVIDVSEELTTFLENNTVANDSINWNAYTNMALAIMNGVSFEKKIEDIKSEIINSIAKQYSEHNQVVPIWLSVGDIDFKHISRKEQG